MSAFSAQANELTNIVCERPGIDTSNQFDLVGTIGLGEDLESVSGSFSITTRRQGRDSINTDMTVEGHGSYKVIAAGSMGIDEVIHFQFVNKDEEVEYISIVGNHPGALSSQIRMSNGVTYRSKCEIN